jgi:hypothetical protein
MCTLYPRDATARRLRSTGACPPKRCRSRRSASAAGSVKRAHIEGVRTSARVGATGLAAAVVLVSLLSLAPIPPAAAGDVRTDPAKARQIDRQLHAQLGARIQQALCESEGRLLRFEVIEISAWRLGREHAEFVLWGLIHEDKAPPRMLRVESSLDRRSLQLGALDLQHFDERQALPRAPLR